MKLRSSPKIYNNYKSDYPENTINRIKNKLDALGLTLKYKEKAVQSKGFSLYSGDLILQDFGFSTTGKGVTSDLAQAGAYAEMSERISAGFTIFYNVNFNIDKFSDILKDVIDRKFLRGFTKNTRHSRITLQEIRRYFQGALFTEQFNLFKDNGLFDILVDSYSLRHKTYSKIPIQFIEMMSGSNGLAAGNTLEEAITQGSCEIFERFAASYLVSHKIICPTIDINSIKDERIQHNVEMLDSLNIEVIIKDFTFHNNIPVVGVLFINHNIKNDANLLKKGRYYKMINVASHMNLNEAILRCFTERLQELDTDELKFRRGTDVLYNFWTESMHNTYKKTHEVFRHFFRDYYYDDNLSFMEKGKVVSLDGLRSHDHDDFLDDIQVILEICQRNNWDMQVVDCTQKYLNFPAVRIIIPPISTDSNPYMRSFLRFKDLERQFNFFYGIKDFYHYCMDQSWMDDNDSIKKLIHNIEDALSKDLSIFEFYIRRGPFYQCINLFNILAFLHLSIKENDRSLKYLTFLHDLQKSNSVTLNYFNRLFNPNFTQDLYSKYITMLDSRFNSNVADDVSFRFESNPFTPETNIAKSDKDITLLMERFKESYFQRRLT